MADGLGRNEFGEDGERAGGWRRRRRCMAIARDAGGLWRALGGEAPEFDGAGLAILLRGLEAEAAQDGGEFGESEAIRRSAMSARTARGPTRR